ncbi:SMI1/KNR4 family protein [Methylomonas montana]|uniref:SMI1/KNR4 family protein n=1 Tax=Methylomonas montana TaxID=3058963 RepID=UPI002659553D|nr:SMI1/KNR4 family protein [Methylomonas montana]WKJ91611.1 SMI1/KNR4 family protein [Methylomonas montana]
MSEPDREWRRVDGASPPEIAELQSILPFDPPVEYLELLRYSNGGEGELSLEPLWFQLFDIAFAIQLWRDENYRREYPDLFFFGSNGGLESITFDMSNFKPWPIVMVDCIAGLDSAGRISSSIEEFIQRIGFRTDQEG